MDDDLENSIDAQMAQTNTVGEPAPQAELDPVARSIDLQMRHEKFAAPIEQLKAGAEGVAKGIAGPLAPLVEKSLGVKGEDITAREEENPGTHFAGEALGLAAPALLTAGISTAGRVGLELPEALSAVKKLSDFTQLGLLSKAGRAVSEFSGLEGATKLAVQLGTENALFSIGDELSKEIQGNPNTIQTAALNVGLSGLIGAGLGGVAGKGIELWESKFGTEARKFVNDAKGRWIDHANGEIPAGEAVTAELENAYNDSKKIISELGGADPENKAISEFTKATMDFEKAAFTKDAAGVPIIDPDKIETLVSQASKGKGAVKQGFIQNFIDAVDGLHDEVEGFHSDLNATNPYERPPLTATRAVLDDLTPGMKFADFVHKNAINLASEGVSTAIGGAIGHSSGVPFGGILGGYFGHQAIKPFMKTIMPLLIKPLMDGVSSAAGMKAAIETLSEVVKGDNLAKIASKSIFTSGKEVIPESLIAKNKDIEKLDKKVQELGENPASLLDSSSHIGHYLPEQATALGTTTANAIQYLNNARPKPYKAGPLDPEIPPTKAQTDVYERTLSIAQQPLTVLKHLKNGDLQSKDVFDLNALYPSLYNGLKQKVSGEMVNHVANGGKVPYDLRIGLSLFLGHPLDPSLMPEGIQAAQATFIQAAQPAQSPGTKTKKSTSPLSKAPNLVATPLQSRALAKTSE